MIVDTLIHARWIIPVEPESVTLENHSLVIDKGRIIDLLPTDVAKQKYQGTATENLTTHALLPGFVNCHTHAAMALMRGIADDLPLDGLAAKPYLAVGTEMDGRSVCP